ncbi:MAG: ATP-binding protein [Alphaproteobacteria bacterium]|nr:ATP-binding protein [Alphaproteobacteria bacterium]
MESDFNVFLLLLNNISIFVVLIVGYAFLIDAVRDWPKWRRQAVLGLFFGLVAIGSMYVKIPVVEGVIVDQRNAIIVLSGAFGGPFAALVSGTIAAAYRTYLGGAGALAGVFGVTLSAMVGAGLYYMRWYKNDLVTLATGAFLAVLLTAPGFLLVGDLAFGLELMKRMLLPWGAAIFMGIFLGGLLLSREDRRQKSEIDKRKSEALYRQLFESSMVSLWILDLRPLVETLRALRRAGVTDLRARLANSRDFRADLSDKIIVTHVNKACLNMYGAQSSEELIGRRHHVFGPESWDVLTELVVAIWEERRSLIVETEHRSLDGRKLTVLVSIPIPKDDAGYAAIPASIMDLTDRVAAEGERDRALQKAQEADKAKSDFLAAMSHELRTPLNAILGFSDIIAQRTLGASGSGKYQEYAGYIHSSGELLLSLVDDILDIAAIESGRKALKLSEFELPRLVDESISMLDTKASAAGVTFHTDLPDSLSPVVGDRRAVQQILLNLLSNSVKYTPTGGQIRIAAKSADDRTSISVADTGKGIPPDRLTDILQPFVRSEDDPMKAQEGWGLGLSIARSLVELHHGQFDIDSTLGQGTTVTFDLPNPLNGGDRPVLTEQPG